MHSTLSPRKRCTVLLSITLPKCWLISKIHSSTDLRASSKLLQKDPTYPKNVTARFVCSFVDWESQWSLPGGTFDWVFLSDVRLDARDVTVSQDARSLSDVKFLQCADLIWDFRLKTCTSAVGYIYSLQLVEQINVYRAWFTVNWKENSNGL